MVSPGLEDPAPPGKAKIKGNLSYLEMAIQEMTQFQKQ